MKNESRYEAERWFKQAEADLKTVEVLIQGERYYMACFLSQQVAEKTLKSFLYAKGEEFIYGHSVSKLCLQCAEYDDSFKKLRSEIKNLDQFYIEARYPNGLPDDIPAEFFDKKDADQAYEKASKAVAFVDKLIHIPD